MLDQLSLVLVPQYFGSLVFDRRTSRYMPFDQEATELLLALHQQSLDNVLASWPSDDRETVFSFVDVFDEQGFFDLRGRLLADVLEVAVPDGHLVGPLAVHLEVIAACNLSCSHCFAGVLPRNDHPLSLAEMDSLFGELASLGSFRLGLTGGEPLMRKDLFDILDSATGHGLHPCLTTNGLLVDEAIAKKLGERGLVWLNVSLEGPDAASNDAIRGAGTFDAVVEKLKLLGRYARFTLAFTITKHNASLVRECAKLAYEVGAHTAVFRPMYPAGVGLEHLELMPSFSQYTGALRDLAGLESLGDDIRSLDPFGPETRESSRSRVHTNPTCGAGQHICSISVQGDVNPCSFLGSGFDSGNLRERSFGDIWRTGQHFRRMREESDFRGGCRARSQTFAGSVDAPDPWFEEHLGGESLPPGANVEVGSRLALPLVFGQE